MNSKYTYDPRYTDGVERTLAAATDQYPRLSTFRFDLRFPADGLVVVMSVISALL